MEVGSDCQAEVQLIQATQQAAVDGRVDYHRVNMAMDQACINLLTFNHLIFLHRFIIHQHIKVLHNSNNR
jgi:hypothetical protein